MVFRPEQLLGGAIEATRHALRYLEADQIPATLKRVAGYSDGTLPPPFAWSLLVELDTNDFLRSKAMDAWKGDRPTTGDASFASHRFLERDDGWVIDVAAAAFELGGRVSAIGARALEVERDTFAAQVASLEGRLKTALKDCERLKAEVREEKHTRQEPIREEREAKRRLGEQLEEVGRDHVARVEELESELSQTRDEIRSVREAAHVDRRQRAEAEAAYRAAVALETPSVDADTLAEHLDVIATLAVAIGPGPELSDGADAPQSDEPLRYPGKIRPDSAEGVEWLMTAECSTVLVDGYNLGFELAERLDPPRARLLVVEVLRRLAATSEQSTVVAVFDSEIEVDTDIIQSSGPVDIVFSSGRSADDEIVDRAGAGLNTVVVTNDRDLRYRAEEAGAVVLWSDALVEWGRRR